MGSPFLAILGPPGPSWAHLGPLSQPSCHPTSPLGTSMAELRPPKPHLASFAEPSTCPEHRYLRRFSEVCYLPSSQHVALNLALQNPKGKPKSLPRHPKIGPRSAKKAQDGPKMVHSSSYPMGVAIKFAGAFHGLPAGLEHSPPLWPSPPWSSGFHCGMAGRRKDRIEGGGVGGRGRAAPGDKPGARAVARVPKVGCGACLGCARSVFPNATFP